MEKRKKNNKKSKSYRNHCNRNRCMKKNDKNKKLSRSHIAAIIVVSLLTLATMIFIFIMSAESKTESGNRSGEVTGWIIDFVFGDKIDVIQKNTLVERWGQIIRKLAHMIEYAILSAELTVLCLLCLRKKNSKTALWLIPLAMCAIYASSDEIHQIFSNRGPAVTDVLIDCVGGLVGICTVHLANTLYLHFSRKEKRMRITYRRIQVQGPLETGFESKHPGIHLRCAVIADLHDCAYERTYNTLKKDVPDIILIPGDLTECMTAAPKKEDSNRNGLRLLRLCSSVAPTFYSFGNHEQGAGHVNLKYLEEHPKAILPIHPAWKKCILDTGAVLLDESWTQYHGVVIGGMGSGLLRPGRIPDMSWIPNFCAVPGYKILMMHQPEYYDRFLRPCPIDCFVSGHAHGGQWRFFGRGVYAPDQGLFPKYTNGIHEGRLVITKGVANSVSPIPRLFNPTEIVMLELQESNE